MVKAFVKWGLLALFLTSTDASLRGSKSDGNFELADEIASTTHRSLATKPTRKPTPQPTRPPTKLPTPPPTPPPTPQPTQPPTISPTPQPTQPPTKSPTPQPTQPPTKSPTPQPTQPPTKSPTPAPTPLPTKSPTPPPTLSTPPPTPPPTQQATANPTPSSIVPNFDFESTTIAPWTSKGSTTIVQKSSDPSHVKFGNYGGLVTGRGHTWEGIQQNMMNVFTPGVNYEVSVWARLTNVPAGSAGQTFYLQVTETYTSAPNEPTYIPIASGIATDQWQQFSGTYALASLSGISSLTMDAEGPNIGVDFAIDNVVIRDAKPSLMDYIVSSTKNTEHVTIPSPPQPDLTSPRTNCPDVTTANLVPWNAQFTGLNEGQDLTIPAGMAVLVDQSVSTKVGLLTIPPNSALIFADNDRAISMDVNGIDVQGHLVAGSETCRYESRLVITLHGSRPAGATDSANAKPPTYKGISVTGRIDLHGKRFFKTWTRLAKRASPGDTSLYLQDMVNWQPGQEIVLVTSAMRDTRDWHQNEVLTIDSVQTTNLPHPDVAAVVHLTSAIAYEHIARPEYQTEVGLLTRNIMVQGSEADSPPTDLPTSTCQLYNHNGSPTSRFGYDQVVCPDKYLTGYGGHIMVHSGGTGYVEGVELYRMGQTNVLGRYPMHFHRLGEGCPGCYLKDSSVHESYYRCISIHATNGTTVSENVAYDITGFCYYLEDGVEEKNTISFNLGAHVHFIGSPAIGDSQLINYIQASLDLTLPADVAASAYYITNLYNTITGNVAVGGWAGYAIPILDVPNGPSATSFPGFSPRKRPTLLLDGNTAHSTAHFWDSAGGFYWGGSLFKDATGLLTYNAGRDRNGAQRREPCVVDGTNGGNCVTTWNRITNSKVFLVAGVGLGSWSGHLEVIDYEAHDVGRSLEALDNGFWIDNMMVACRTGESLLLPKQNAHYIRADGFFWYDTGQKHIITDSTFRNCGIRSDTYNQYDMSDTRGCNSNPYYGCSSGSTVFGLLTHSDQFNPQIMQATRGITMTNVGRRFKMTGGLSDTVSGRTQNWLDVDGSVSGLGVPALIGSGLDTAGKWWRVDDDVVHDFQGPLTFIQKENGPARGLAYIRLAWDNTLHNRVGVSECFNGGASANSCPAHGYIRHLGTPFDATNDPTKGLPVTANPDIAGLAGGYGWHLTLNGGSPKQLTISRIEVDPATPLILAVAYPTNSAFTVKAKAADWCSSNCDYSCEETMTAVGSVDEVRKSPGNVYYFDISTGLLYVRVTMISDYFTGTPFWKLATFNDPGRWGNLYSLSRFERDGILLPSGSYSARIEITSDCASSDGVYCLDSPPVSSSFDNVCKTSGFEQVSYDRCCDLNNPSNCEYANSIEPTQPPTSAPVDTAVIRNGNFEGYGLCPWTALGPCTVALAPSDFSANSGSAALVTQRSANWNGITQPVTGRLEKGTTYRVKANVKVINTTVLNNVKMTLQITYDRATNSNTWIALASANGVTANTWVSFDTTYTHNPAQDPILSVSAYFETPGSNVDFMVDNVSMTPQTIIV